MVRAATVRRRRAADHRPNGARPGARVATGHAMLGMTLGPITGRLVAEILTGLAPSVDLTLMSPDRF